MKKKKKKGLPNESNFSLINNVTQDTNEMMQNIVSLEEPNHLNEWSVPIREGINKAILQK